MTADPQLGSTIGKRRKLSPTVLLRIGWSVLRRRWFALSIAAFGSLVVAVVGSQPLKQEVWKASTLLLYTAPSVPNTVGALESTFSLANVSGFATCRPVMTRVVDQLELPVPPELLGSMIEVETSRLTTTVFMSLEWADKDEAREILESVTRRYPEHVASIRQAVAGAQLKELEGQLDSTRKRLADARTKYRDFVRERNIVDFNQDLILKQTKILSLETELSQLRRDEESMHDQVKMLEDHIASIRKEEKAEAAAAKQFEAAEETLADNRRRQNRLRELISEERRILEVKALINVKRREYARVKKLVEKQLAPVSRLEAVRAELEALISKIAESEQIMKWGKELKDLDKLVVPQNPSKKKGSPIIHQILFKKLETELKIAHGQKGQIEVQRELEALRRQIELFQRARSELQGLDSTIETIDVQRKDLENKVAILRQLTLTGPMEFATISPVTVGTCPVRSNRKKLFVGLAMACMCVAASTIGAHEVLLNGIIPLDAQVELLGLPVLTGTEALGDDDTLKIGRAMSASETVSVVGGDGIEGDVGRGVDVWRLNAELETRVKTLALKIRQTLPESGQVIMMSQLTSPGPVAGFSIELAKCFASRDERVVIVDVRQKANHDDQVSYVLGSRGLKLKAATQEPGLSEWLSFKVGNCRDIVRPTRIPAVDVVDVGNGRIGEKLATHRMCELFNELRCRYTIIILLAHSVSQLSELEILSAHADGIVFSVDERAKLDPSSVETIAALYDIDAPLMGVVEV